MDLPFGIVIRKIKSFLPEKKQTNKESSVTRQNSAISNKAVSSNAMITSEEEMLKRFRMAMVQSKSRSRVQSSATTPSPLNATPFDLKPIEEKDA